MCQRQILVCRVAVCKDLRHAVIVTCAGKSFAPVLHGFGEDGEAEHFAIGPAASELLQEVPLEPGAERIGLAPKHVHQQ